MPPDVFRYDQARNLKPDANILCNIRLRDQLELHDLRYNKVSGLPSAAVRMHYDEVNCLQSTVGVNCKSHLRYNRRTGSTISVTAVRAPVSRRYVKPATQNLGPRALS